MCFSILKALCTASFLRQLDSWRGGPLKGAVRLGSPRFYATKGLWLHCLRCYCGSTSTEEIPVNKQSSHTTSSHSSWHLKIAATMSNPEQKCSGADCDNDAGTLQCPTCLKLGVNSSYFCNQDCFKRNWVGCICLGIFSKNLTSVESRPRTRLCTRHKMVIASFG